MMRQLERYLSGQHAIVWMELLGQGGRIRDEPDDWAEAQAIAIATMARVRRNIERLRDGLPALGYRFKDPGRVLVSIPDAREQVARVEAVMGPMPLALAVFWEMVGDVDLNGHHDSWPQELLDPLMVGLDADYFIATREDDIADAVIGPDEPFGLDFAPDPLHKANISGGAPYAIEVPNPAVDGLVLWEVHQTTFVNYLRTLIGMGGMGGFSSLVNGGLDPYRPEGMRELLATLEPF